MKKDEEIILKQRSTFKNFMHEHELKAFPWSKKAGISEATIRNYIHGLNQSLTSLVLEKLAQSINVSIIDLIGSSESEEAPILERFNHKFNQALFIESFIKAEELIEKSNLKASSEERAKILSALYELACLDDSKTQNNKLAQKSARKRANF